MSSQTVLSYSTLHTLYALTALALIRMGNVCASVTTMTKPGRFSQIERMKRGLLWVQIWIQNVLPHMLKFMEQEMDSLGSYMLMYDGVVLTNLLEVRKPIT